MARGEGQGLKKPLLPKHLGLWFTELILWGKGVGPGMCHEQGQVGQAGQASVLGVEGD